MEPVLPVAVVCEVAVKPSSPARGLGAWREPVEVYKLVYAGGVIIQTNKSPIRSVLIWPHSFLDRSPQPQ